MAAPIALRADYDGTARRRLARRSDDADQTRRLLALTVIYDGGLRGAAAGPQHPGIRAPSRPTSSAPSAPRAGAQLASSCSAATQRP
jgi:hypothetical protein